MQYPLLTGFFLGLSLIVAIGGQNAFVLRQGILKKYTFSVALFCSISDSILIFFGVFGLTYFLSNFINQHHKVVFLFSALWLIFYGILRLFSALKMTSTLAIENSNNRSYLKTMSIVAIFTYANPHVYLDTVILIGSISQKFIGLEKIYFALGACIASFFWFFGLSYFASLLSSILRRSLYWRILDTVIAFIMFLIAFSIISNI